MVEPVWEPWLPQVGDEVEVWLSAECICPHCEDHAHGARWDPELGYKGTVRRIHRGDVVACRSCGLPLVGHYYLVLAEHLGEEPRRAYGWVAAIEMRKVGA